MQKDTANIMDTYLRRTPTAILIFYGFCPSTIEKAKKVSYNHIGKLYEIRKKEGA